MTGLSDHFAERFLLEKTKSGQPVSLMREMLVDADALVALAKTDDSNHAKAVKINSILHQIGVAYYLSPFTVAEATTVLSHKVSQLAAKKFLQEMRKINLPVLELAGKNSSLADGWFFRQKKKGSSYFDCYNMALLDRHKTLIGVIFSFDSVYKRNGFKTTGKSSQFLTQGGQGFIL